MRRFLSQTHCDSHAPHKHEPLKRELLCAGIRCSIRPEITSAVELHQCHRHSRADCSSGGAEGTQHGAEHTVIVLKRCREGNFLIGRRKKTDAGSE